MTALATAAAHPDVPTRLHRALFPLYHPHTLDVVLFWELPAQKRAGHVLVQGASLGAPHAALQALVAAAETMKAKRSMYAETHRERLAIVAAVRACEWNRDADPVAVHVKDGAVVEHDFREGCVVLFFLSFPSPLPLPLGRDADSDTPPPRPCHASVSFTLRNMSLTHPARAALKLVEPSFSEDAQLCVTLSSPFILAQQA